MREEAPGAALPWGVDKDTATPVASFVAAIAADVVTPADLLEKPAALPGTPRPYTGKTGRIYWNESPVCFHGLP